MMSRTEHVAGGGVVSISDPLPASREETEQDLRELSAEEVGRRLARMVEPTPGRIAVQVSDIITRTKSGLYLPTASAQRGNEKPTRGTVVALPPGSVEIQEGGAEVPTSSNGVFKVGDVVLFTKFSGVELNYGRERVIIMSEDEIVCKLLDADASVKLRT